MTRNTPRIAGPAVGTSCAVVLLAALLLTGCGAGSASSPSPAAEAPAAAEYTCSMHPQIRQPKPGRCPLCGMDLIPVSGSKPGTAASALTLSDEARALASVETVPVARRAEPLELRFLGRMTPDPTKVRQVTLLTEGRLENLIVNYCCAPVRKGQPMAEVYSPDVLAASREWLAAAGGPDGGTNALFAAAREKLLLLGVGEVDLERAWTTRQPLKTFVVTSPMDGTATEIMVQQGQWLMRGMALARIDDLSNLWMELDVTEGDIARVRVGQPVSISMEALPGRIFRGEVNFPQRTVEPDARVLKVRVVVPNPDGVLLPGMFGRATIAVAAPDPAPLTIPATAPLLTGRRAVVYVADASRPGTYEGREVELGERRGDWYEVKSGLREGEQVVSRGAFQIDSAIQIEGRPSMMTRASPVPPPVTVLPAAAWRGEFAPLVELYLAMAEHLAADNFASARDAAEALPDALGAVRRAELPASTAAAWTETESAVSTAAGEAAAAKEIESLRAAFDRISAAVVAFVGKNGSPLADPLDLVHCPMAFNNRGADWLQRRGAIRNPYFGARMLECGEVTETIPGAAQAGQP